MNVILKKKYISRAKIYIEVRMDIHGDYMLVNYSLSSRLNTSKNKPDCRERLIVNGPEFLSTQELMMILLGTGTQRLPVKKLSRKVLDIIKTCDPDTIVKSLLSIEGIGDSKACVISAALELGRRLNAGIGSKIFTPLDIIPFVQHITLEKQEHFLCICLNGAHEIISIRTVSVGTLNRCIIHPREVFAEALKERGAAIILAHNHPSGNTSPSENDIEITKQLFEASKILGIHLLDHIIFCIQDYFSFAENGLVFLL